MCVLRLLRALPSWSRPRPFCPFRPLFCPFRGLLGGPLFCILYVGRHQSPPPFCMQSPLPPSVLQLLSSARSVVVCGSRRVVPPVLRPFLLVLAGLRCVVACGCCGGVPALCRLFVSRSRVFSASAFSGPSVASRLVARSCALVRSVVGVPGALWCSFPLGPCPSVCRPGAVWCSCGSGSWSSLALAVGLGVPALVWLPSSVRFPWAGAVCLGGGWWFVDSSVRVSVSQQALF